MASSLSNLVNNPSEAIHKFKCKYRHSDQNVKFVELHTKYAAVFLDTEIL